MIRCWPVFNKPPAVKNGTAAHVHRPRRFRRVAHAAISKPAIIGYLCIATGALIPPLFTVPAALPAVVSGGRPIETPGASVELFAPVPPGLLPTIEFPVIGPPLLLPDVPLVPAQPVSEPSSLALLATAVAVFVAWRKR